MLLVAALLLLYLVAVRTGADPVDTARAILVLLAAAILGSAAWRFMP